MAIGYYLWHGFTWQGPKDESMSAWVGPQMAWPISAMALAPILLAFTGDSVVAALTGRNSTRFRDALIGIGTILSTQPTGMSLNDQPELRINLSVLGADGQAFESWAKMVVPLNDLAAMQPGAQLPVRYLPGRLDRVEVDRSGDSAQVRAVMN
jgi:hypothetical protein